MSGILTLIPTPIDEESELEQSAFKLLEDESLNNLNNSVFVIEDLKPGRKRWLKYKLPRAVVDHFVLLNEHTYKETSLELLSELKSGKNIYLMSDGGLPAFCDPGKELVQLCHINNIKVTATSFCNSVILAVALSGLEHKQFVFLGFPPVDKEKRREFLNNAYKEPRTIVLMDTPYRLKRLLEELRDSSSKKVKKVFLACDLGSTQENLYFDSPAKILKKLTDYKREFILIA